MLVSQLGTWWRYLIMCYNSRVKTLVCVRQRRGETDRKRRESEGRSTRRRERPVLGYLILTTINHGEQTTFRKRKCKPRKRMSLQGPSQPSHRVSFQDLLLAVHSQLGATLRGLRCLHKPQAPALQPRYHLPLPTTCTPPQQLQDSSWP